MATDVGADTDLGVEVFDQDALIELGCGGLLGVNLGSVKPARMIRLRYVPPGEPTGILTLVGKGIMYDSGGISLKPSDASHSTMKNDMSGAGSVLASMSALSAIGCTSAVIGYLMCTDNMPSGPAMNSATSSLCAAAPPSKFSTPMRRADCDVRRARPGDRGTYRRDRRIATLTGAALRTLGTEIAAVLGNDQSVVEQVKASAE